MRWDSIRVCIREIIASLTFIQNYSVPGKGEESVLYYFWIEMFLQLPN